MWQCAPPPSLYLSGSCKMKASLKGRYETEKGSGPAALATLSFNAGDVELRASFGDSTFVNGPSLKGLALGVEKPGFFIVDYNVPEKDLQFQFMSTTRVAEKPLNLTYSHSRGQNMTILDGTLVLNSSNKLSANHVLGSRNCKLKYTYVHKGVTAIEPCYDLAKNSWDFAVARKVYGDDVLRVSYQISSQALGVLGLEWSRDTMQNGSFKILASVKLDEKKVPKLIAESTWNFEI